VVPFLQAHPDMTLQHDNATNHTLVLCVISCKTGMSVFCHGQRSAYTYAFLKRIVVFWFSNQFNWLFWLNSLGYSGR
jgi:hypothetical protein